MSAAEPARADWTGSELEITAGAVGHGGFCIGRVGGRVVFVRHALPGERVRAVVTEDRGGGYCRADAVAVLRAAPARVDRSCPVAGPGGCGGCDFQHVAASRQRELEADVVTEQLRRIAGIEIPVSVERLPGGALGWRQTVRLTVDDSGRPGFTAHRSHRVVPVATCPVGVDGLLDGVTDRRWRPGSELEVSLDDLGRQLIAERRPGQPPRPVRGPRRAIRYVAGRRFALSPGSFWQVHAAAAVALTDIVAEWAALAPGDAAWDLYGGVGLFGAVLAEQVGATGSVTVVESSKRAVADGRAALADLPQVGFVTGKVQRVLPSLGSRPEVVVLDPPRSGAGKHGAAAIAAAAPSRIVHVACDPAALARDVAAFAAAGYRLARLRVLDAFPMTHHVECVALLA